jgi:hypothetical protein
MATTVSGSATVGGTVYGASASITLPAPVTPPPPVSTQCLLAVYDPSDDYPSNWNGVQAFENAGCPVRIVTYYVQWQGGFPATLSSLAKQHGVIPFIELEPWFTQATWPAFTSIAAGQYDSWLQSFASSIKSYGLPVYLTYAHEMNGSWYPWGNGGAQGVTAAQWVASWQHVTSLINSIAPGLVTWVWAPNNSDVGSVVPYWPGGGCLASWDGYLQNSAQSFSSFLAPTLAEIRTLTSGPVWLAETSIAPNDSTRAARIPGFLSDLKAAGVSGLNWFNQNEYALSAAEMPVFAAGIKAWNAS